MKVVVSSAAEAELGALFHNGKEAAWLRTTLTDMGHPQPPTPIQTDNACAAGIANDTVKQRRSKAVDMRFYWIRDRVAQKQFVVHWRKGADNLADYFTKHHSPAHHRLMRSRYLLALHRPTAPIRSGEGVLIPMESSVTTIGQRAEEQPIGADNQPTGNRSGNQPESPSAMNRLASPKSHPSAIKADGRSDNGLFSALDADEQQSTPK
jgi:hypothetical protein